MSVEVFDVSGRMQKAESSKEIPQADGVVINISHLPVGTYFVKIATENGIVTRKVIKN